MAFGKRNTADGQAEVAHPCRRIESTGLSGVVEHRGKDGSGVQMNGPDTGHRNRKRAHR